MLLFERDILQKKIPNSNSRNILYFFKLFGSVPLEVARAVSSNEVVVQLEIHRLHCFLVLWELLLLGFLD